MSQQNHNVYRYSMNEYLTIKEFAKLVNKTPQAIYKRLSKKDDALLEYYKVKNNKKYIHKNAVKLYFQPVENNSQLVEQPVENNLIKELKNEVEFLKDQLKIAQANLGREQALHADTRLELKESKKELLQLKGAIQPVENNSQLVEQPVENTDDSTHEKKWWQIWKK